MPWQHDGVERLNQLKLRCWPQGSCRNGHCHWRPGAEGEGRVTGHDWNIWDIRQTLRYVYHLFLSLDFACIKPYSVRVFEESHRQMAKVYEALGFSMKLGRESAVVDEIWLDRLWQTHDILKLKLPTKLTHPPSSSHGKSGKAKDRSLASRRCWPGNGRFGTFGTCGTQKPGSAQKGRAIETERSKNEHKLTCLCFRMFSSPASFIKYENYATFARDIWLIRVCWVYYLTSTLSSAYNLSRLRILSDIN